MPFQILTQQKPALAVAVQVNSSDDPVKVTLDPSMEENAVGLFVEVCVKSRQKQT